MVNNVDKIQELRAYTNDMFCLLEQDEVTAKEYSNKINDYLTNLLEIEKCVSHDVYSDYKEFVDSFAAFCKSCENEVFLKENIEIMGSTLSLLSEVLADLLSKYNDMINNDIDEELCKNGPLVSVIMSTYNHEPYVAEAIESIVNQTYKNIEFLVADDGSIDGTVDIMKKYSSHFDVEIYYNENSGGRFLELYKHAKGKYVALSNSDDIWDINKLAIQIKYLEEHPECGACFTWCEYFDENRNYINDKKFFCENRSRSQWLRLFWDKGNCLCHPSVVSRREYYCDFISCGFAGRQIPDFFRWIDLVQKTDIYVCPKVLTFMRWYRNDVRENTSAGTRINLIRTGIESGIGWFWNIRNMQDDLFIESFRDLFINKDASTKDEIKIEKYFLLKNGKDVFTQNAALFYFNEIYGDVYDTLEKEYGYYMKSYWEDETGIGIGPLIV